MMKAIENPEILVTVQGSDDELPEIHLFDKLAEAAEFAAENNRIGYVVRIYVLIEMK